MCDDFGLSQGSVSLGKLPVSENDLTKDKGKKRSYLRVYETLPPQLLNAYGPAKYPKLSDKEVWENFSKPLKSGGQYMSEMCSPETERRGVGINRWLHAMVLYCQFNNGEETKKQNQYLLSATIFKQLYKEIDQILPSLEYCLAPKKEAAKSGASSLRAAQVSEKIVSNRTPEELAVHAKKLYEWLDVTAVSRIRMLSNWQAAGGMSFVGSVHHRAAQCFRYQGNSLHSNTDNEVSLTEFQAAIKIRHEVGSRGIETDIVSSQTIDFQ